MPRSVALALHGRLASWQPTWVPEKFHVRQARGGAARTSSWDIEPHSTLRGFARFVHSTIWERIVLANRRAGLDVEIYLHSWNPEIGQLLDDLYQPKRSRHEPTRPGLHKVPSQHLSMKSALQLSEGEAHELVLVMRHDVIWYEDFLLANLSSAPLWLPHWCLTPELTPEMGNLLRPACAAQQRGYMGESYLANQAPKASSPSLHMTHFKRAPMRHSAADLHYTVLDWWFAATPAVARTFGAIYDKWDAYKRGVLNIGPFTLWTHFFWAFHIRHVLRAAEATRFTRFVGVDFQLARLWRKGSTCSPRVPSRLAQRLLPVWRHAQASSPQPAAAVPAWTLPSANELAARIRAPHAAPSVASRRPAPPMPLGGFEPSQQQCPPDARNPYGMRLQCPWYSPSCPVELQRSIFAMERFVLTTMNATTRLPRRRLHSGYAFNALPDAPVDLRLEFEGRGARGDGGKA